MVPRFLIVAATPFEIEPFARHFNISVPGPHNLQTNLDGSLALLVTGVGMVNTAYALGRCPDTGFDYVINAGVCGAFDRSLALGEVVHVITDTLSEMGAENDTEFIPYPDMNLGGTHVYHRTAPNALPLLNGLPAVGGITVNTVHGNDTRIREAVKRFNPQVESMEGAAFFRGCAHFAGNCLQVRAVSNYVEKRDKNKWNMKLALTNLTDFLTRFINELNK